MKVTSETDVLYVRFGRFHIGIYPNGESVTVEVDMDADETGDTDMSYVDATTDNNGLIFQFFPFGS